MMDYLTVSPGKRDNNERVIVRREKRFVTERLKLSRSNK